MKKRLFVCLFAALSVLNNATEAELNKEERQGALLMIEDFERLFAQCNETKGIERKQCLTQVVQEGSLLAQVARHRARLQQIDATVAGLGACFLLYKGHTKSGVGVFAYAGLYELASLLNIFEYLQISRITSKAQLELAMSGFTKHE